MQPQSQFHCPPTKPDRHKQNPILSQFIKEEKEANTKS